MGSAHTQGAGLLPGVLGRRDLVGVLERFRQRTADARRVFYVRPGGASGLHWVRNFCNEQEYMVGSALGSQTFRPGTVVFVMSHAGTAGEVIVAGPPPGRAGASAVKATPTVRPTRFASRSPAEVPVPILGRSYLALWVEASERLLHAWEYRDGTYVRTLGVLDYSALPSILGLPEFQRVHSAGDTVVFQAHGGGLLGTDSIVTWPVGSAAAVLETEMDSIGGPVWSGGQLFFTWFRSLPSRLQLFRAPVGASGTLDLTAAALGPVFVDGTNALAAPSMLCSTGRDLQIPSFLDDEAVGMYVPNGGGAWRLRTLRDFIAEPDTGVNGSGFPVTGNRCARITDWSEDRGGEGRPNIGILPPVGARGRDAERALLPAGWPVSLIGGLSVSPDGTQLCLYSFDFDSDPGDSAHLFRVKVADSTFRAIAPEDVPRVLVTPGPSGELPSAMLCRD